MQFEVPRFCPNTAHCILDWVCLDFVQQTVRHLLPVAVKLKSPSSLPLLQLQLELLTGLLKEPVTLAPLGNHTTS